MPVVPLYFSQKKKLVFIYLGFCITVNTVLVISQWVVRRTEETSTYSWSRFCTVNCRPNASNSQLSNLRPCLELNPGLRGGRRECYHSATVAPEKVRVVDDLCNISFNSSVRAIPKSHLYVQSFPCYLISAR